MTKDLTERLKQRLSEDHLRGCEGRQYDCTCGFDDETDALLTEAASLIQRLEGERAIAHREASALAMHMFDRHYRDRPSQPALQLLSDPLGVITQIDNMYTGIRDELATAEQALSASQQEVERLRAAMREAEGWFRDYERQHRDKGTVDGDAKAQTNRSRADFLARSALQTGGKEHG